jgi:SAM-dependent methyltransferase
MRSYWDARAREDAVYLVDTRQAYGEPDLDRLFADGEQALDRLLELLGVRLGDSDAVVEIGCGVGRLTRPIAERVSRVVALDVSSEMLERARELNPTLDNVDWVLGDGVSLSGVEDGSTDACISVVTLQHLPESELALGYVREVGRVLRPGGWAALQFSNDPAYHKRRLWPRTALRALVRRGPRGSRDRAWLGSALDLDDLRAAAREGGLTLEELTGVGTLFCCARLRKL